MTAVAQPKQKKKVSYEIRPGFRVPVRGEIVGSELERIKKSNGNQIIPAVVVNEGRPVKAPLHPCFEWNDAVAAELHREEQARYLIRSVICVETSESKENRAIAYVCVSTGTEDGERAYVSSTVAMSDDDMRAQIIADTELLLRGIVSRYKGIPGLKGYLLEALHRSMD